MTAEARKQTGTQHTGRKSVVLALILLAFAYIVLQSIVPLGSAVKIGADEDFELSKATLCQHGYHLYSEIWDDQPPLDTFLITEVLKHCSPSVLGPRLLTVGFAATMLGCLFLLVLRINGLFTAWVTTVLLLTSPGFLELSSSCMQEIPALAPIIAAIFVLSQARKVRGMTAELVAGALFAFALQLKLIGLVYAPLIPLLIWLKHRESAHRIRQASFSLLVFCATAMLGFTFLNYLTGNSLLLELKQAWGAHFAMARSFEYGSPADHRFDWAILARNWDMTLPALVGVFVMVRRVGSAPSVTLPLLWLLLTLSVFAFHEPWWAYYYIHNAIPLAWCAGVGIAASWGAARRHRNPALIGTVAIYSACALAWMGTRVYLEEKALRGTPRLSSCFVLQEIERFKPYTTFMFTDRPVYSFHAGIPMPPHLAVISLKRFWAGEMTNERITAELEAIRPGLILLANDNVEVPFETLLAEEYRLVYRDAGNRLYAHQSISRKPGLRKVGSPP